MALYLMGRNAEALADVDRSLSLDPGEPATIDTRAHVLAALGRPQEALAEFERAIELGGADLVRAYQDALAKHGYYRDAADGVYGPQVRVALVACLEAGCRLLE
jgi:tetratricopeptide (TPR) repeat protein